MRYDQKLLRKKQFLNSVEFRDTDIFLPIDPNLKDGEKIKITDLKARVRVPGKSIDIENAQCFLNGIKILKNKRAKFHEIFNKNSANFSDGLISTAVVEAANKSLKNNSNWQKINLK